MAHPQGTTSNSIEQEKGGQTKATGLEQQLQAEIYRFSFFQALRRLECHHMDKPRLGSGLRSKHDGLRLGQNPSMAFAPSSLAKYQPAKEQVAQLSVNFFGLLGPNGPMPLHFTEYTYDRLHNHGDASLCGFLDMFHHRMLSFFYRAWADTQPTVHYDRPHEDRFMDYVGALMGIGQDGLRDRNTLADKSKLFFAGRFAQQNRNVEGLRDILSDYLNLPVEIQEFVGKWVKLPEEFHFLLGDSPETASLGENMLIGAEKWCVDHSVRIVVGPVNLADFQRLQPGGRSMKCIKDILCQYLGDELQWDVQVVLHKDYVPPFELGCFGELSRSLWLCSEPPLEDVKDLIIDPMEH